LGGQEAIDGGHQVRRRRLRGSGWPALDEGIDLPLVAARAMAKACRNCRSGSRILTRHERAQGPVLHRGRGGDRVLSGLGAVDAGDGRRVVKSLQEGGDELLTFFRFPKAQRKTLRTTNVIERLNEEFRRRVKTQGALPTDDAAVTLLFSLVASGQIKLRKSVGGTKGGSPGTRRRPSGARGRRPRAARNFT
jgi:hypothetical protein